MNWKTKQIMTEAKAAISDVCIFSEDQISVLNKLIDLIGEAIDHAVLQR